MDEVIGSEMKKVLCIDDDPDIRILLKKALKDTCEVIEAEAGEEGLKSAIKHKPSLVLVDIMLPGLSGYDVVMKLRQNEHLKNIPILAITAYGKSEDVERARTLGFDDYIIKPFNINELKILILRYLSGNIAIPERDNLNTSLKEYSIELIDRLQSTIDELRSEKRFIDSIIQCVGYGLMVLDGKGHAEIINPEGINILSEFVENMQVDDMPGILGFNAGVGVAGLHKGSHIHRHEIVLETKKGEERVIGYSAAPRYDASGSMEGTIISFRDITDLRRLEKEMERVNKLSTFAEIASAVAHEIRNPLAGIKTMAQSVEENINEGDENKEYMERIIRQVDRLNELLKGFFSYSKLPQPQVAETSLAHIINEVKPLVNNELKEKGIRLTENYEEPLPEIFVDAEQIQQVFLNLFLNSIDAVKSNGHIEINAAVVGPDQVSSFAHLFPEHHKIGKWVKLEFKDNGAGMRKDTVEKAFEPFFTTKSAGSGLGLAIVYRILRENSATITVVSEEGEGTTIIMYFRAEE